MRVITFSPAQLPSAVLSLSVMATSLSQLSVALALPVAAEVLASRGIQAEVVNCRFLKPYDRDILKDVAERHRRVITIEEGAVVNGFGAYMTKELSALALERTIEVRCLGLPDRFIEHGAREVLLRDLGLDAEGITTEARRMIGGAVTAAEESA